MAKQHIDFYTFEEVSEKLGVTVKALYNFVSQGRFKTERYQGTSVFVDKNEIDSLETLLKETYSYKEVVEFVKKESQFNDLHRQTVKNYMEKYFGLIKNPLNGKDYRFYKKDKHQLIDLINENYYVTRKPNEEKFQDIIREAQEVIKESKGDIPYISSKYKGEYYEFRDLKAISKKSYTAKTDTVAILKHIINVCKEMDIIFYTNKNQNNIYIKREDISKYKDYYEQLNAFNPNDYYTTSQVKELFEVVNTDRIALFADAIKVKSKLYFNKEKIDELLFVKENAIKVPELYERYDVPENTFRRWLTKLEIEIIPAKKYPYFGCTLIYKKDIPKIDEFINQKGELETASSYYEKFHLETKEVKPNVSVPQTLQAYDEFIQQRYKDTNTKYVHTNLVNAYKAVIPLLTKEIMRYDIKEIGFLADSIPQVVAQTEFKYFIDYCRRRYMTKYKETITIESNENNESDAYTKEQWTTFALLLYTKHEELIPKCVNEENRVNAMVWLYCALHYVCAWRAKDMVNMPYPELESVLGMNEEEVIESIKCGEFTEAMAQAVVNNVMFQIKVFHQIPSKNKNKRRKKNTQRLKFVVSDSYVYTLGMLIALCESHRRLAEKSAKKLLTKTIITERATKRERHIDLFGEEYNKIFGEETFQNTPANKTYFNFIQVESQNQKWGQGYDLASILRGHRKDKQGIAQTTQVYLKHINKNSDVHKITESLAERGSFGFMSHLAQKVIHQKEDKNSYFLMDMESQTREIQKMFGLKPKQIELMVNGIFQYRSRIHKVFNEIVKKTQHQTIKEILQKVSMGEAPSKMEHSQCLLKAINRSDCAYPIRDNCIGCEFHMGEMYFLMEFNRYLLDLVKNLRNTKHDFDKKRYTYALFYVYMPILQEAISYFGKERVRSFVSFSTKDIKELQQNNLLSLG